MEGFSDRDFFGHCEVPLILHFQSVIRQLSSLLQLTGCMSLQSGRSHPGIQPFSRMFHTSLAKCTGTLVIIPLEAAAVLP